MKNDMANAGNFRYKSLFVNGELVALLEGFIEIYGLIVKSDVRLENDEKIIRKEFVRHLKNKKYANSIEPFKNYSIDAEVEEGDGFLDLKITPRKPLVDPMDYFSIECKRLDNKNQRGKTGLNAQYVKEGINRYKEEKYTTYHGCNGMFGFVVADMDVWHNIPLCLGHKPSQEMTWQNRLKKASQNLLEQKFWAKPFVCLALVQLAEKWRLLPMLLA